MQSGKTLFNLPCAAQHEDPQTFLAGLVTFSDQSLPRPITLRAGYRTSHRPHLVDIPFVQILRPDPTHPIRKRLWQAAGALGLIMLMLVTRETIVRHASPSHRLSLGEDFLPVYAAGRLVREGRAADLYAMEPLAAIERRIVAEADLEPLRAYGPFLNPPFFAAAYVPFSAMPYRTALSCWVALNALLLAGSVLLICRLLPRGQFWPTWALVSLLIVLPLPFWEAVWYQQNTFVSLFLTCAIVSLWRAPIVASRGPRVANSKRRFGSAAKYLPDPCGLLCGLLFYKPQLALAIAVALVFTRGLRAMLGLMIAGGFLLLFTLEKMPGTLWAFLHTLPPTIHWLRTALPYNWGQQLTPQSFWRLLIQGHGMGETGWLPWTLGVGSAGGFAIALFATGVRNWKSPQGAVPLDRYIGATICTMPLLMPYYMDYDLLVLAVPAALFAAEWLRSPGSITRADRFLFAAWMALFLETYINPGLGAHLGLNLSVPLIGVVAGLSISRCFRPSVATATAEGYHASPLAAAA